MTNHIRASSCAAVCGLISTLLTTANAQAITLESVVRSMNFTSNFSMEYFTHNKGGVPQIRFTLRYVDYDITNWAT